MTRLDIGAPGKATPQKLNKQGELIPRTEDDWLGVDPYREGADIRAFGQDLSFKNDEVDEIYSSHTLEHVDKFEVLPMLKEWIRVLKQGGKLTLLVPDLVWCVKYWLKHQSTEWEMDIIFGHQNGEGEFH